MSVFDTHTILKARREIQPWDVFKKLREVTDELSPEMWLNHLLQTQILSERMMYNQVGHPRKVASAKKPQPDIILFQGNTPHYNNRSVLLLSRDLIKPQRFIHKSSIFVSNRWPFVLETILTVAADLRRIWTLFDTWQQEVTEKMRDDMLTGEVMIPWL